MLETKERKLCNGTLYYVECPEMLLKFQPFYMHQVDLNLQLLLVASKKPIFMAL